MVTVTNLGGSVTSSNASIHVAVPQQLHEPVVLANGTFSVISGDADGGTLLPADLIAFEAQVSTNLIEWSTLTNSLSLTNGALLLTDPDATNASTRFYRLVEH